MSDEEIAKLEKKNFDYSSKLAKFSFTKEELYNFRFLGTFV